MFRRQSRHLRTLRSVLSSGVLITLRVLLRRGKVRHSLPYRRCVP